MNIFLDSNSIFTDPFFRKPFPKNFLKLAAHEEVTLYMSSVVYKEIKKGYEEYIEKGLIEFKNSASKLNAYIEDERRIEVNFYTQEFSQKFEDFYAELIKNEKLQIIDYEKEALDFLVEIDMLNKPPFIKDGKKEIRDAIIWNTYERFITKNKVKDCYFISNNVKEFGGEASKKSLESLPYKLHSALNGELFSPFKNIKGFMEYNRIFINTKFEEMGIVISDELVEKVNTELEGDFLDTLINKKLENQLLTSTFNFLNDLEVNDIFDNYLYDGYVSSNYMGEILETDLLETDFVGDEVILTALVKIHSEVEVYFYNPYRDKGEDKYTYDGDASLGVEAEVTINIPIDVSTDIKEKDFSFDSFEKFSLKKIIDTVDSAQASVEIMYFELTDDSCSCTFNDDYIEDYDYY